MFKEYMHVERFGNDEVQGIELGRCYIFPKIDGTNASVWINENSELECGSRKRQLSIEADNAGFMAAMTGPENAHVWGFLGDYPHFRLYGEWLVPHSLKTYRDDAWRKFYVFDVWDEEANCWVPYEDYQPLLEEYGLDYVPCIAIIQNAEYANLLVELEQNNFLIQDGKGAGEGIVIKNYEFENRFGRVTWAKIVTSEFKEKHQKSMGAKSIENKMVEQDIVDEYVTSALVEKTYAKIVNECEGWNSKYIPRLLQTVFYDLVTEESWNFVKAHKMPTINFRTLNTLTILRIKELKSELF